MNTDPEQFAPSVDLGAGSGASWHNQSIGNPSLVTADRRGAPAVLLGRYQLLELIGEGGMGIVWRGFDLDLEEPVAIKFLRDEFARDEALRAAFRREVKLSRRVTHPNVARVYEFGRDDQTYFLTMEYIAGESLQALLARVGTMPAEQVQGFIVSLCQGLAAAHAVHVVHGDIKPGNILIEPTRGAVLTDFGIARVLSEAPSHDDSSSGTPLYMSPEQLLGGGSTLPGDIYAVGVVLFEILIGTPPWRAPDLLALIEQKCNGSDLDLLRVAPGLAGPWAALITDCLRADPALRPPDALALLARLTAMRASPAAAIARPPPAPLATGEGATWIELLPFHNANKVGEADWVTSDLAHALTQIRGLRVVTAGSSLDPSLPPLTQVRGEVRSTSDGVVVSLHIVDHDTNTPRADIELHQPDADLHNLGVDLAARIAAAIEPGSPTALPQRYEDLDAETSALYVEARRADAALRPSVAIHLYESALARAPGHPLLQLGRALSRLTELFLVRELSRDEIAEARALAEAATAEHPDRVDGHLATAGVLLFLNDPLGSARSLRLVLHRAPSLVRAHGMVADLLLDIGRLPDAERRLDIAAALDWDSVQTWMGRARQFACQERWAEFYGVLEGKLTELRFRTAASLRFALWHPDTAALARIERALIANHDNLPPPLVQDARDVVAFALGRDDRRAVLERFAAAHPSASRSRYARIFAQIQCDMACTIGDLGRARESLAVAGEQALIDWHWLEYSPTLAPLRDDPLFATIREQVRARADAVAEAIWDWTTPT